MQSPLTALLSRPALACLTVLILGAIAQWVPGLERARLFGSPEGSATSEPPAARDSAAIAIGETELKTETISRSELWGSTTLARASRGPIAQERGDLELPSIHAEKPPVALAHPEALDGFYRALGRTARRERDAITRILYFGDSIIASDFVSGTLRKKLQQQFGDAGHGFVLIANPWPAYSHNGVNRFASVGWRVSRIVGPIAPDGLHGLGGVSFRAAAGTLARFGTAKEGRHGDAVSRFEIGYLEEPGAGKLEVLLDGKTQATIDTAGSVKKFASYEVRAPDGKHELEIVTRGKGTVRAFGVVLERNGPGVVLDALGVQGGQIRFLDEQDDTHFAEQLAWRQPSLLVYQFGANESNDGFLVPMEEYYQTMRAVLEKGKKAVPAAGCLVVGIMDRAAKVGDRIVSMRVVPHLYREQKRAAAAAGCAFFDTYQAMGGQGSMPIWVRRGLGQADLTHPSGVGSEVIGTWIYRALMDGYNAYLARTR